MSFFKNVLSKVGIGAAKIDTVLDSDVVYPGAPLTGTIHIEGGKVAQSIQKIDLDVRCNYMAEVVNTRTAEDGEKIEEIEIVERTATLIAYDLPEVFEIQPGEQRQVSFSIEMPLASPLTLGHSNTWVETNLDIEFALDKSDRDYLQVNPNKLQAAVLEGLESLGLVLADAENEEVSRFELPFMQELEFEVQGGIFAGHIEEVEVIFINREESVQVLLEIDRHALGIAGFFTSGFDDESRVAIEITYDNIEETRQLLEQVIRAC